MLSSIESARNFIFVSQVHYCAMYAIVVWEWFINFNAEWNIFWNASWTPVKAIYLFCRYWVLATIPFHLWAYAANHTLEVCQKVYKIPPALAAFNILAGEAVLLLRTYAFLNRDWRILVGLVTLLAGVLGYQMYVAVAGTDILPFLSGNTGPCLPQSKPHSSAILGYFIAPLLFDTLVTTMTIAKAVRMRRRNGPSSRIIQVFLREGVFYYLMISFANLINGIFYLQPRQDISAIMIPFTIMLGPILACRLILDIRKRRFGGISDVRVPAVRSPSISQRPSARKSVVVVDIELGNSAGSAERPLFERKESFGESYGAPGPDAMKAVEVEVKVETLEVVDGPIDACE